MNIVIIGVGYVGLVSGLAFAKTDNNVQFLDLDVSKIDDLKKKKAPFFEPLLEEYLNDEKINQSVSFHSEYDDVDWDTAEIIMVCVQTPTTIENKIDSSFLNNVFKSLSDLTNDQSIICIKSTIHPEAIQEILDNSSLNNEDIVFNPEFLREGQAFNDFFNPDRVVIGAVNKRNAERVAELYKNLDTELILTDPISSQLIKYLSNAYLPLRLSFVNEASQIIKKLGGNLSQTLLGIGLDSRIGNNYFRPSPGWGGSCFPKDVTEINSIIKANNLTTPLISNINESNKQHQNWFSNYLIKQIQEKNLDSICLIGLAFKEDTDDTRYSPTISIYENLKLLKKNVYIYDFSNTEDDSFDIRHSFAENSLIVEMYPLSDENQTKITKEINKLENYDYLKFWE
tara:strand:- start:11165 stop:12358 length:1194 start_codon:yes stop_codon:yes gene_type:complete